MKKEERIGEKQVRGKGGKGKNRGEEKGGRGAGA
jgi:hypothetical protein